MPIGRSYSGRTLLATLPATTGHTLRTARRSRPFFTLWRSRRGFTIIEILIVIAIICVLAAIATPGYVTYRYKARMAVMLAEIRMLEKEIFRYTADTGSLPENLSDINCDHWRDIWGQPYQYLKIAGEDPSGGIKGKRRRDRNMNPVNSDFDLYSMGGDCRTQPQFTAKFGRDDIVRARDGVYLGLAQDYY